MKNASRRALLKGAAVLGAVAAPMAGQAMRPAVNQGRLGLRLTESPAEPDSVAFAARQAAVTHANAIADRERRRIDAETRRLQRLRSVSDAWRDTRMQELQDESEQIWTRLNQWLGYL